MATKQLYDPFSQQHFHSKQGVDLMGHNHTGPPCSISCPTTHVPGPVAADGLHAQWPGHPPAAFQTTTSDNRCQRAKQYCPNRRASNKLLVLLHCSFWNCNSKRNSKQYAGV